MKPDQNIEKLKELLFKKCNADIDEKELFQDDHITADQIDEILSCHVTFIHKKMDGEVLDATSINAVRFRLAGRAVRVDDNKKFVKLRSGRIPPWLTKANPSWKLWEPYKQLLLNKPISPGVVDDNEKSIDSALDLRKPSGGRKLDKEGVDHGKCPVRKNHEFRRPDKQSDGC